MSPIGVEEKDVSRAPAAAAPRPNAACPLYLDVRGEAVLVHLHPAQGAGPAVLLCPPFGGRDINSYRSRFIWAERLAAAGMPALRLDLPGTGDSGGSLEDPGCLDNWIAAVDGGVRFLRAETGRRRIAAIGIGLGGLLALAAVAEGSAVDDLVLWGVPARGRALVRELAAFARMESESIVAAGAPEPPDAWLDSIAPGGFVLPAEAIRSLEELDVADLELGGAKGRRALLLGRDGIAPDDELHRQLEAQGVSVEVADGRGFADMMSVFHEDARLPEPIKDRVEAWLLAGGRGETPWRAPLPVPLSTSRVAELSVDGVRIRETPIEVAHEGGRLAGVLSEAVDASSAELMFLFLNAGAMRRVGPCGLWVDLARRWAARGVSSLRIDLDGIGDSSGGAGEHLHEEDLYAQSYLGQIRTALDELVARGASGRFVLIGLCSGAYWAFQTALVDDRVSLAVMLNPRLLFWSPETQAEIKAEIREEVNSRNRRSQVLRLNSWRRVLGGGGRDGARQVLAFGVATATAPVRGLTRLRARSRRRAGIADALERLRARGARIALIFCDGEPLRDELSVVGVISRLRRWPHVELVDLPGRDHILRPVWMHEHVKDAVDDVLACELTRVAASVVPVESTA
ncbi:MAG TPA: hypothetical protein VNH40_10195 [Gaiellaceae bacterium]|nr:hypothetical protein [Gaiellaceae bacterium]